MSFITLAPGVISTVQAEQASIHGGRAGLKPDSRFHILEDRIEALAGSASTDLASLAACYGYSLAYDQPFHDANLSTALIATELCLTLNGHTLSADDTNCFLGFMVVANGELSAEAFADWLRRHIVVQ